jgi:threonine dehydratase
LLPLDLIRRAQTLLQGLVHRTPLVHSSLLSTRLGAPVYLKLECLQKTGSFKPRGAFVKMHSLSQAERLRGVVAVSGGNHAGGVAYAARHLGIRATIVMPASTPANYVDAARGYGANVILTPDIRSAFAEVDKLM